MNLKVTVLKKFFVNKELEYSKTNENIFDYSNHTLPKTKFLIFEGK